MSGRDVERLARALEATGEADASDLAPLVDLAERVRRAPKPPLPPGGLRHGRTAFVAAGVARAERRGRLWHARLATFRGGRLALVATLVALALGLGATRATAGTVPGDVLFPVKRFEESIRLALARGDELPALERAFAARRRAEVVALLERTAERAVAFEGIVQGDGDRLLVGGVAVAGEAALLAALRPGDLVHVEGRTDAAGRVIVQRVHVRSAGSASGPAPTPIARRERPERTRPARATTVLAAGEPTPTATSPVAAAPPTWQPPSATPAPSPTATASPAGASILAPATPRLRPARSEWTGIVADLDDVRLVVDGRAILLAGGRVDEQSGPLAVGARVRVIAEERDGAWWLVLVVVLAPADGDERVEWQGTIESMAADTWTVGGLVVAVTPETVIDGEPALGRLAHVVARRAPDGPLSALSIAVLPDATIVEFSGVITAIGPTTWWIDGRPVALDAATTVEGTATLDARVEARARTLPDGALLALWLRVVGGVASVPTPAVAALPEPSATTEP